jgi:hypothetical protein
MNTDDWILGLGVGSVFNEQQMTRPKRATQGWLLVT